MSDLNNKNRELILKKQNHAKMVAMAQIEAREIRIMELEDEIARNHEDIEAQNKVIADAEAAIKLQREEMEREAAGVSTDKQAQAAAK